MKFSYKMYLSFKFYSYYNDTTLSAPTVAIQNINPINFDITAKPLPDYSLEEIFPSDLVNLHPPAEVQSIISQIVNNLGGTSEGEILPIYDEITTSFTSIDFPDKDGHTLIKMIEDGSGKTLEVIHEAATMIPLTDKTKETSSTVLHNSVHNDTGYVDVYIIIALVLLILMTMCIGMIVWCRKNKLKSVKRNAGEYPIVTEYMNNQVGTTEKLKNIP